MRRGSGHLREKVSATDSFGLIVSTDLIAVSIICLLGI